MAEPPFRWRLPYRQLSLDEPARPFVPVRIRRGDAFVNTRGLIDSGADRSLFSAALAPALGIDLTQLAGTGAARGVGGEDRVDAVDVEMYVAGVRFPARLSFSENWTNAFGLLGRADFFRAFRVAFDERAEAVFLDPYDVD